MAQDDDNFSVDFQDRLKVQGWALYTVAMLIMALRFYARAWRVGLRGYQADDYLMIVAAGLYTALIVFLNIIAEGGGSNLYPPERESTLTQKEIQERILGSKLVVVSEQAMLNVIYTIKAAMLLMYTRLTLGLRAQHLVRCLAVYVAVGWAATEIAFFTACRPFREYWALPPRDPQCATLEHYAMVQGCFNISSDVLMLFIPLPLVLRTRLPWRQKIVLLFVFGMGVFVIVAALLTKIFNLTNVYDPSYMLWYVREASVAVYVSNLPMIWPSLREWLPCLRSITLATKGSEGAVTSRRKSLLGGPRDAIPSSDENGLGVKMPGSSSSGSSSPTKGTRDSVRIATFDDDDDDDILRGGRDSTDDLEMGVIRSPIEEQEEEAKRGNIKSESTERILSPQ